MPITGENAKTQQLLFLATSRICLFLTVVQGCIQGIAKNNYFKFNGKVKQQISGTAIGTKFAPPYACIFMDEVETSFIETQEMKALVWFRYIDDVFYLDPWTRET